MCKLGDKQFLLVDIPGTYSLMSNSEEEEIARDYICFENPDCTIVVVDATCLERNLNLVYQILEITTKVVVCVNLLDEAKKKGITIDLNALEKHLQVPVVGTIARKKKTLKKLLEKVEDACSKKISYRKIKYSNAIEGAINTIEPEVKKILKKNKFKNSRWISQKLLDRNEQILTSIEKHLKLKILTKSIKEKLKQVDKQLEEKNIKNSDIKDNIVSSILFSAENICIDVVHFENENYNKRDRRIDKILTSKVFGIPIMIAFLIGILWITITGANYPSQLLSDLFANLEVKIVELLNVINTPSWVMGILVDGIYKTLTWVVAVMLPPMAIFFPLFTLLEDLGYLPRISFNLDNYFKKACTTGKQALTMCMGFGCNAAGVVGCRIIDSPRERLIAMLTNAFVPCNGRFPFLITIASIFIGGLFIAPWNSIMATLTVVGIIILGIVITLLVSKILSKTLLKGMPSSYVLELPPYRKPQIGKVIVRSIFDRTLFVLGRAVIIAIPAGVIIWICANVQIGNLSILTYISNFLDPFANLMGIDGVILAAFILALPANEIVLPIILMCYMSTGVMVDLEDLSSIGNILIQNGWTIITAINVMIFCLLHFPCSTTLLTIKKEAGSVKWMAYAFVIPTVCGIVLCMITNGIYNLIV